MLSIARLPIFGGWGLSLFVVHFSIGGRLNGRSDLSKLQGVFLIF